MHQLVVIAVPPVTAFDLSIPELMFGAVRVDDRPVYDVRVCTADPHLPVACAGSSTQVLVATGLSPLQWLLHQRIERARELLECTNLPMDQIARHSGLGTAESLRQHVYRRT